MSSKPYIVLGTYHPHKWNKHEVMADLCTLVSKQGLYPLPIGTHKLHKGLRWEWAHADLMRRVPKNTREDCGWHQDGDLTGADMNCIIVLWSSNTPTLIRTKNNIVYRPNYREVVAFHNKEVFHKRPDDTPVSRVRWAFRQRCKVPTWWY